MKDRSIFKDRTQLLSSKGSGVDPSVTSCICVLWMKLYLRSWISSNIHLNTSWHLN